jgi:hypothetical protein
MMASCAGLQWPEIWLLENGYGVQATAGPVAYQGGWRALRQEVQAQQTEGPMKLARVIVWTYLSMRAMDRRDF